jgi:two-component system NtrC family sensor kinase
MSSVYNNRSMLRTPIFRPLWLPTAIITISLLTTIGIMVTMSWRNLHRLQPVHKHLAELNRLQQIRLALDETLEPALAGDAIITPEKIQEIKGQINELSDDNTYLDPDTPKMLNEASQALETINQDPAEQLLACLAAIRAVVTEEYQAHDQLMARVRSDTQLEFKTAISTFIVLPLLAFGIIFLLRNHIFEPLSELATLMRLLARQDFKPAVSSSVGPVLKPLFDNYNHMVSRLAKLEQQNRARQVSLENQVRTATHALLEQQREMAAAERLAAVGELAAGLAHELRNPLAAMQVALNNLRQEIDNSDHSERLAMIVNELNRVTALLNGLLSQAQQEPERSVEIKVDSVVNELATLASFQIGENIQLQQHIPADLTCRLPAGRMHQALLNLVLNAAQAIGDDDGIIDISAEYSGNKMKLTVSDDGPGFPPAMLHNGIRPFFSARVGGTGLGLGIVQRFARDLGGEISLANRQPHGAIVTLTLPCENQNG